MTTGISLVRENTASMRPPRALWVPFPLGRPLGVPGDVAFQHRVITAALDLLERDGGPVLEDFPDDAPPVNIETMAACPVSFAKSPGEASTWKARLTDELSTLAPWYDLGRRRRGGRTLVGVSGESPLNNIEVLGALLDELIPPTDIKWLKHAIEDLKVFYLEAMTAQPGDHDTEEIHRQFWHETNLGAALLEFYAQFQHADDRRLQFVARMIAPREAVGAATGPEDTP